MPRASPVSVYLFPGEGSKGDPSSERGDGDSELGGLITTATEVQAEMAFDEGSEGSTDNDDFCILEAPGMGIPVRLLYPHYLLFPLPHFKTCLFAFFWFVTAERRGAGGHGALLGAHQGEGQPLLQAPGKLGPAPCPQSLPSPSEQSGVEGNLRGLASLWRKGLWQQAHVHTCPTRKQVRYKLRHLCLSDRLFSFSHRLWSSSLLRGRSVPAGVRGSPSRSAAPSRPQNSWRWAGGSGRQHTLLMEIQLTKV